jgi:fused signal recognition particle receptor
MSFIKRLFKPENEKDLKQSLSKTKEGFFQKLGKSLLGKTQIDENVLDELEQILISSDVGLATTIKIIDRIQRRTETDKYLGVDQLNLLLRDEIVQLLTDNKTEDLEDFTIGSAKPHIILVVGVNGVGKTTTIGKLAYQYSKAGKKVLIAAGDTFRAAAEDQLKIWSERVNCLFFTKGMGADPSAVAYEAVQFAVKEEVDVVIIDTAGRLHTKINLMGELGKINRSIGKSLEGAPHEVLLILDATTGQNAIEQCKQFSQTSQITGLVLTKLDGTAKGGVAIGISDQFKIPIKYIGVGEGIEQLQVFNKKNFVNTLFEK